jgi:N-acetylglucosaminyldiphosphoundecaprenol N-acetyl-beta-D-mannosaminyltransferase
MAISPRIESFTVGGINVSCVDRAKAVENFFLLVFAGKGGFITVRDAHGIVEAQTDSRLRDIINSARMTLPDGMPIVWVGKLKNASVQRVPGTEFVGGVMRDPKGPRIRHYFYGGQTENTSRVVERATELLGPDAIAGWYCPPLLPVGAIEDESILARIAKTRPDVIWVGLSTPKQEYWMANHAPYFPKTILVGIGAAFDFFAGIQTRAPSIIQQAGFEWLFRVCQEPQRLGPRYRRVVPGMLRIMIAEMFARYRTPTVGNF